MPGKIEKGVPLPQKGFSRRSVNYQLGDLDIDDSFVIPLEELVRAYFGQLRTAVSSAVCVYGKRNGKMFVTRVEGDREGVRVWRVK